MKARYQPGFVIKGVLPLLLSTTPLGGGKKITEPAVLDDEASYDFSCIPLTHAKILEGMCGWERKNKNRCAKTISFLQTPARPHTCSSRWMLGLLEAWKTGKKVIYSELLREDLKVASSPWYLNLDTGSI